MLRTHDDIVKALSDELENYPLGNNEKLKVDAQTKGTKINTICRFLKIYNRAEDTAEKFGFIGVGCITFAQLRLQTAQRRLGA